MKMFGVPDEDALMLDPVHVEHTVDFTLRVMHYPFGDMDKYDFFRIAEAKQAQATRAAAQRYYEKEPMAYFVVRKLGEEWICRRIV